MQVMIGKWKQIKGQKRLIKDSKRAQMTKQPETFCLIPEEWEVVEYAK